MNVTVTIMSIMTQHCQIEVDLLRNPLQICKHPTMTSYKPSINLC